MIKRSKSFIQHRLLHLQRLTVVIELTCESVLVNLAAATITVAIRERLCSTVFIAGVLI